MQSLKQSIQRLVRSESSSPAVNPQLLRPRLRIHWVLPDQLAIGRLPKADEGRLLLGAGVKVIVSLCAEAEGALPTDMRRLFNCQRFILPDSDYLLRLNTRQLSRAVQIVHHHLEREKPVYIHCLAGVERSPTVCIAYLCLHRGFDLLEAVTWMKQVHPASMPTEFQLQVVRDLIQQQHKAQLHLSNDDLLK